MLPGQLSRYSNQVRGPVAYMDGMGTAAFTAGSRTRVAKAAKSRKLVLINRIT